MRILGAETLFLVLLVGLIDETLAFATPTRQTPPLVKASLTDRKDSGSLNYSKQDRTSFVDHHDNDASSELPLVQLAVAGALTTFMTDILMHPVDCVKTLQQTDHGLDSSFLDTALTLYANMGLQGFYSGFFIYALADGSGGAFKFAVWETWKKKTAIDVADAPSESSSSSSSSSSWTKRNIPNWILLWIGAGLAFVASSVVIVPGELLKNQLQVGNFAGLDEAVAAIYQASGAIGFYNGYEGVLYRDVPYTMLELGLYEQFKAIITGMRRPFEEQQLVVMEPWQEIAAAAATGGVTALATTPIDVIKTKLMVDHYDGGFVDCVLATVSHHGISALFAGVYARIGWILPFTAVYLPTYDFLKRRLLLRHIAQMEAYSPAGPPER